MKKSCRSFNLFRFSDRQLFFWLNTVNLLDDCLGNPYQSTWFITSFSIRHHQQKKKWKCKHVFHFRNLMFKFRQMIDSVFCNHPKSVQMVTQLVMMRFVKGQKQLSWGQKSEWGSVCCSRDTAWKVKLFTLHQLW